LTVETLSLAVNNMLSL